MPKPSPNGLHVAHGIGGGWASIDNVIFSRGAVFGWPDDQTVLFANGDDNWYVSLYDMATTVITRVDYAPRPTRAKPVFIAAPPVTPRPFSRAFRRSPYQLPMVSRPSTSQLNAPLRLVTSANWGYAGGGVYATWFGGSDPAVNGLWTSTGVHLPAAGLLNVGPDGAVAYKPDYQSMGPSRILERNGEDWILTAGHADYISMHAQRTMLYMQFMQLFPVNMPQPVRAPGGIWKAEAMFVGGQWWLCPYYANHGIALHPFTTVNEGYSILPKGDGWHQCAVIGLSIVRIYVATSEGEQAGQLWVRDIDVIAGMIRNPWGTGIWESIGKVDVLKINATNPTPPPPPPPPPPAGMVTIVDWGPATGVAPLTVTMRAGFSGDVAKIQWLRSTVGGTWQLDADPRDPLVDNDHHMTFTEPGSYVIGVRALDVNGNILDQTGVSRVVVVTASEPKPEYPPLHPNKFCFGPTIASADLLEMFRSPDQWATARERMGVFNFFSQQIRSFSGVGPNTYEALIEVDAFRKLREWGIATAVEKGSVKEGDWDARNGIGEIDEVIKRIEEAGGHLDYINMDEPLTAAMKKSPPQPLSVTADAVAEFIKVCYDRKVRVNWLEAWPNVSIETMRQFLVLLDERGALPHGWHLDCDMRRAAKESASLTDMVATVRTIIQDYAITTGVFLAGYPASTDMEYVVDVKSLASHMHTAFPDMAQVIVESWVGRRDGALQDVPRNLPESSPDTHTALFNYVVELFS